MNISILGCGWLGLPLAKKLNENGHSVKGSTTQFEKKVLLQNNHISPYIININDSITFNEEQNLAFWQSELIIIAIPPRIRKSPIGDHISDLQNLISFLKTLQHKPWIFYTSTTGIYENTTDEWLTEQSLHLVETYASIESTIKSYSKNIVFRLAGLVNSERLIINFLSNKEISIQENEVINLIHQDDVIETILAFISKKDFTPNEIYNICSDEHPLKKVFYIKMCLLFKLPSPIFKTIENSRGTKKISNQKITTFLNLKLKYPDIEIFYRETVSKLQKFN